MAPGTSWRQIASGIAAIAVAAALAMPSAVLAQDAPEPSAQSENQAADAAFADALARHVARPSAETRLQLIEVAKPYFALLQPGQPFPDARGLYDATSAAETLAAQAEKARDFGRAAIAYRLAIALDQGEPGFGPPRPWQGSDIFEVEPLINVLVADRRHDAALAVIRAVLAAPDSDVRDSLFTMLGNDMSDLLYGEDPAAAEAFARMGIAAAEGSGPRAAKAREPFDEALRVLANRRILAAVPDVLAAPDPARLDADQRREADRLLEAGLGRMAANDAAAAMPDIAAVAAIYGAAWDPPVALPDSALGQRELGQVLYSLVETLGSDGNADQRELAMRLKIAVALAERAGSSAAAAPDAPGHLLDSDTG